MAMAYGFGHVMIGYSPNASASVAPLPAGDMSPIGGQCLPGVAGGVSPLATIGGLSPSQVVLWPVFPAQLGMSVGGGDTAPTLSDSATPGPEGFAVAPRLADDLLSETGSHFKASKKSRRKALRRAGASVSSTPLEATTGVGKGTNAKQEASLSLDEVLALNPAQLEQSPVELKWVTSRLRSGGAQEADKIVRWLAPGVVELSLSRDGCRLVQEALGSVGASQNMLLNALVPRLEDLYDSPHGNFVLTKAVEVLPSAALGPLIARLRGGLAITMAKHRFGCRILERLIEHCSEAQLSTILDELAPHSFEFSWHQYGNFVVQHIFEFGSAARRQAILGQLLSTLAEMAIHQYGSHVVQKAFDFSDERGQADILAALFSASRPLCPTFEEVAGNKYGVYVVETLFRTASHPGTREAWQQILDRARAAMLDSEPGRRSWDRLIRDQVSSALSFPPSETAREDSGKGHSLVEKALAREPLKVKSNRVREPQ